MRQHLHFGPDRVPFFRSPLNIALTLGALLLVSLLHNGYTAYRSDHLSQIPLLYLDADPTLFARDWFYRNFPHTKLRFAHVSLIKLFASVLGIPLALLVIYLTAIGSVFAAWMALARRLYGSVLPGVIAALFGIFFYGEIGSNHVIERSLIPRAEAYAVAYWGLFLLIVGRPLLAGVVFGVAGCFQPAVAPFFAIPLLLWIPISGFDSRLKTAAFFLGGILLVQAPWIRFLRSGFEGGTALTGDEVVEIVAQLRHPVLMLPRYFGESAWGAFFVLVAWAMLMTWRIGAQNPAVRSFGLLVPILTAILLISTIFIEFIPLNLFVMAQPFRMSVLLYFIVFLLIAPHVAALLRSPNAYRAFRGIMLVMTSAILKLFVPIVIVEFVALRRDRRLAPAPTGADPAAPAAAKSDAEAAAPTTSSDAAAAYSAPDTRPGGAMEAAVIVVMAIVGGFFIEPEVGGLWVTWRTLIYAIALAALLALAWRRAVWQRPGALRGGLAAYVLIGAVAVSAFFWLPVTRWLERPDFPYRRPLAQAMWKFQFRPVPLMALERVGAWAAENTEQDALFLIPPGRTAEGFRIWSKRSVVFNSKHFPVTQAAYEEWLRRYLIMRGALDLSLPEDREQAERVMADFGGAVTNEDYADLRLDEILTIADFYEVDYVVTPTDYKSERLKRVHRAENLADQPGANPPLFVYEVVGERMENLPEYLGPPPLEPSRTGTPENESGTAEAAPDESVNPVTAP